jgi:hypothetical protein
MNSPRAQSQNQNYQSIDHIITEPPKFATKAQPEYLNMNQPMAPEKSNDNYLPIEPIYLSPQEEQNLVSDVSKELGNYSSNNLKNLYSELTSYDPNVTGNAHYTYITLVAMRNNVNKFSFFNFCQNLIKLKRLS